MTLAIWRLHNTVFFKEPAPKDVTACFIIFFSLFSPLIFVKWGKIICVKSLGFWDFLPKFSLQKETWWYGFPVTTLSVKTGWAFVLNSNWPKIWKSLCYKFIFFAVILDCLRIIWRHIKTFRVSSISGSKTLIIWTTNIIKVRTLALVNTKGTHTLQWKEIVFRKFHLQPKKIHLRTGCKIYFCFLWNIV